MEERAEEIKRSENKIKQLKTVLEDQKNIVESLTKQLEESKIRLDDIEYQKDTLYKRHAFCLHTVHTQSTAYQATRTKMPCLQSKIYNVFRVNKSKYK